LHLHVATHPPAGHPLVVHQRAQRHPKGQHGGGVEVVVAGAQLQQLGADLLPRDPDPRLHEPLRHLARGLLPGVAHVRRPLLCAQPWPHPHPPHPAPHAPRPAASSVRTALAPSPPTPPRPPRPQTRGPALLHCTRRRSGDHRAAEARYRHPYSRKGVLL
jgi:hypothetical protein